MRNNLDRNLQNNLQKVDQQPPKNEYRQANRLQSPEQQTQNNDNQRNSRIPQIGDQSQKPPVYRPSSESRVDPRQETKHNQQNLNNDNWPAPNPVPGKKKLFSPVYPDSSLSGSPSQNNIPNKSILQKDSFKQKNLQILDTPKFDENSHEIDIAVQQIAKKIDRICYQPDQNDKQQFENISKQKIGKEYIFIVEIDDYEKLKLYADKYPALNIRKKLWHFKLLISNTCTIIITNKFFEAISLLIIVLNSVVLVYNSYQLTHNQLKLDNWFLLFYSVEMILKIFSMGLIMNRNSYLREGWNVLDCIIVSAGFIQILLTRQKLKINISALRQFRILRPLKTITNLKSLKIIIQAFLNALPMLCDTFLVLMFVYFLFAVAGLQLFSGLLKNRCMILKSGQPFLDDDGNDQLCGSSNIICPAGSDCIKMIASPNGGIMNFDNIIWSMLQVFQICTMEGWSDIQDQMRDTFGDIAVVYFTLVIFFGNFFVINMMLAVIKSKFSEAMEVEVELEERKLRGEIIVLTEDEINLEDKPFCYPMTQLLSAIPRYKQHFRQKRWRKNKPVKNELQQNKMNLYSFNKNEIQQDQAQTKDLIGNKISYYLTKQESNNQFYVLNQRANNIYRTLKDKQKTKIKDWDKYQKLKKKQSSKNLLSISNKNSFIGGFMNNTSSQESIRSVCYDSSEEDPDNIQTDPNLFYNNSLKHIQVLLKEDSKNICRTMRNNIHISLSKIPNLKYLNGIRLQKLQECFIFYFGQDQAPDKEEVKDEEKLFTPTNLDDYSNNKQIETFKLEYLKTKIHFDIEYSTESVADVFETRNNNEAKAKAQQRQIEKYEKVYEQLYKLVDIGLDKDEKMDIEDKNVKKKIQESNLDIIFENSLKQPNYHRKQKLIDTIYQPNVQVNIDKDEVRIDYSKLKYPMKERKIFFDKNQRLIEILENSPHILKHRKLFPYSNLPYQRSYFEDLNVAMGDLKWGIIALLLYQSRKEMNADHNFKVSNVTKKILRNAYLFQQKRTIINYHVKKITSSIEEKITENSLEQQYLKVKQAQYNEDNDEEDSGQNVQIQKKINKILQKKDQTENEVDNIKLERKKTVYFEKQVERLQKLQFESLQEIIHQSDVCDHGQELTDYENLYNSIIEKEFNKGIINQKNQSLKNILNEFKQLDKDHLNKVINSLNEQDHMINIPGVYGFYIVIIKFIKNLLESSQFESFIITCVLANTVVLAVSQSVQNESNLFAQLNNIFTYIFTFEMVLKLIVYGVMGYLQDYMNVFDGSIVSISLFEMFCTPSGGSKTFQTFRSIRVFRAFRVIRSAKILRSLEFMSIIISVLMKALSSFVWIGLLLFLFIFIFALLGNQMYAGILNGPGEEVLRCNYDSFHQSLLSTFQILTLENWNDILNRTMTSSQNQYITIIYLVSWIVVGNYSLLNLFLAVLLDGFESDDVGEEEEDNKDEENQDTQEQVFSTNNLNKADIEDYVDEHNFEQNQNHRDANCYNELGCQDSIFLFRKTNKIRIQCFKLIQKTWFENTILLIIILTSCKLALDTYMEKQNIYQSDFYKTFSVALDYSFNFCFVFEFLMKIIAYGFFMDEFSYLSDNWNKLDFFIVCTSVMDMILSSGSMRALRNLRLIRMLRPLRFISRNENLQLVVKALFSSAGAVVNVAVVVFVVYLMGAILGMSLLKGKLGYCDLDDYYGINKATCLKHGNTWKTKSTNFDTITNSLVSLFILGTLEGWPDQMYDSIDGDVATVGPSMNNNYFISLFYVIFIWIGTFFFMQLFTGAIQFHFDKSQNKQKNFCHDLLTDNQRKWIEIQQMILKAKPDFSKLYVPDNIFQKLIYDMISHHVFTGFILICIMLNIIFISLSFDTSSLDYRNFLENMNYFFTYTFLTEAILKIIALGVNGYLIQGWNQFDGMVVLASVVDIAIATLFPSVAVHYQFLRIGPQLARVVRIMRVVRLLKHASKEFEGMQKILETMMISLPSLINVTALIILILYVYSILGVFIFSGVTSGDNIDQYLNFWSFGSAFTTLFIASTGENWYVMMFDLAHTTNCTEGVDCGSYFSYVYWLTYVSLTTLIMFQLFVLVIINDFEQYGLTSDNSIQEFEHNLEEFKDSWLLYRMEEDEEKIPQRNLIEFYRSLPPPLGMGKETPKVLVAKQITKMKLTRDKNGNVSFNEILFASLKRIYEEKIAVQTDPAILTYITIQEQQTKQTLYEDVNQQVEFQDNLNMFSQVIFIRMCFATWLKYSSYIKQQQLYPNDKRPIFNFVHPFDSPLNSDAEQEIYSPRRNYQMMLDSESPTKIRNLPMFILNENKKTNGFVFSIPMFIVSIIFVLNIYIISSIGNPHVKLEGADNVLMTVHENLNSKNILEIKQLNQYQSCDNDFKLMSIGNWNGVQDGCICMKDDPKQAYVSSYYSCYFKSKCKFVNSFPQQQMKTWNLQQFCSRTMEQQRTAFVCNYDEYQCATDLCTSGNKCPDNTLLTNQIIKNDLDIMTFNQQNPKTIYQFFKTRPNVATGVQSFYDNSQKFQKRPLIGFQFSTGKKMCLNSDYVSIDGSSQLNYPLLNQKQGCDKFGDYGQYNQLIDDMNQADFFPANLKSKLIKQIPFWEKYQEKNLFYLIAVMKFEITQGKNQNICKNIDIKEIKNAVKQTTSGVNFFTYITYIVGSFSLISLLSCIVLIAKLNTNQSLKKKKLYRNIYVFFSFMTIIGCIALWIGYQILINQQLQNSATKMNEYAESECFQLNGINLALRQVYNYSLSILDLYKYIINLMPVLAVLFVIFWSLKYVVYRNNRNKNY